MTPAIELVKKDLAEKAAEAQNRKEVQERVKKESPKPKDEGTESNSDEKTEKNGAVLLDEETRPPRAGTTSNRGHDRHVKCVSAASRVGCGR